MGLIEHTVRWCQGEIFEGKMIVLAAIAVSLVGFSFWKFGTTEYAKSIFIPFLFVGVLLGGLGTTLITSNPKRIVTFQEAYNQDPIAFVKSEKIRTDAFISWYPKTLWILVVVGTLAMIGYGLTLRALPNSISLALLLVCFMGLMIDHFSKERAFVYAKEIEAEAQRLGVSLSSDKTQ